MASTAPSHTVPSYTAPVLVNHAKPWEGSFTPRLHAFGDSLCDITNRFFLEKWPFRSERHRTAFMDTDLPRWAALALPEAHESRILLCIRFITLLFLIDDELDRIDISEGRELIHQLCTTLLLDRRCIPGIPWTKMALGMVVELESLDPEKSPEVLDELAVFWRAQTSATRTERHTMGSYLAYRDLNIGLNFVRPLAKWALDVDIPPEECPWLKELELNASAHMCLVNDLFSWDKECMYSAQYKDMIAASMVNSIAVVMSEESMDAAAARRAIAQRIRDIEENHFRLIAERENGGKPIGDDVGRYISSLGDMCAGNESWSRVTGRYYVVDGKLQKPVLENDVFESIKVNGHCVAG